MEAGEVERDGEREMYEVLKEEKKNERGEQKREREWQEGSGTQRGCGREKIREI